MFFVGGKIVPGGSEVVRAEIVDNVRERGDELVVCCCEAEFVVKCCGRLEEVSEGIQLRVRPRRAVKERDVWAVYLLGVNRGQEMYGGVRVVEKGPHSRELLLTLYHENACKSQLDDIHIWTRGEQT